MAKVARVRTQLQYANMSACVHTCKVALTYCFRAAAGERSGGSAFHASHFARPIMSNIPGRSLLQGPMVACLNSAYKHSCCCLREWSSGHAHMRMHSCKTLWNTG